jgi:prepilin-type N-terminal cleavage/methylation domain-containing protein
LKRSAFTLVELIFTIVIIGVLAAVAIPKFKSLKESANVANTIKIVKDAESSLPSAAANQADLENNTSFELSHILSLSGKNITYTSNKYTINNSANSAAVATIMLNTTTRKIDANITCNNFSLTVEQSKCTSSLGTATYTNSISY